MSNAYTFEAIEFAEDPSRGSVCAMSVDAVYEDPEHSGIPIDEAIEVAAGYSESPIADAAVEERWALVS